MLNQKPVKPQLHSSHLGMLSYCGHKFFLSVILGKKEPPTTPLIIGTANHAVNALNITNKINKGTLLPKEAVKDYARDALLKEWNNSPLLLDKDEMKDGLSKTKDKCIDITIAVSLEYHYAVAPKLNPVAAEEKWVLEAPGFPYDLAGTMDIRERYDFNKDLGIFLPESECIMNVRDTKTRSRDLGQKEVDASEQYTIYAMYHYYKYGRIPNIFQDTLIKPTKTQPARAIIYPSVRTEDDFTVFHNRFETACSVIDKEAYYPANPNHFLCSKEFCGFAMEGSCKYFNSKRGASITKTVVQTKGNDHGQQQKLNDLKSILRTE